jgi:hypothetical protein
MGFGFSTRHNVYTDYLGFISPSMESKITDNLKKQQKRREENRLGTHFLDLLLANCNA